MIPLLVKCWPYTVSRGRRGKKVYEVTRSVGALKSPFREQDIEVIRNVSVSYLTTKENGLELDYVDQLRKCETVTHYTPLGLTLLV